MSGRADPETDDRILRLPGGTAMFAPTFVGLLLPAVSIAQAPASPALLMAAVRGDAATVSRLLALGANAETKTAAQVDVSVNGAPVSVPAGSTALHVAAAHGHADVV